MNKIIALLCLLIAVAGVGVRPSPGEKHDDFTGFNNSIQLTYEQLTPDIQRPTYTAFYYAMKGYLKMNRLKMLSNNRYLTIVDFSLASNKQRLWVIDLSQHKIVQNSLVAHGKNSGLIMAHSFSNSPGSFKSSIGFFLTGASYDGKHGLSLRLQGIEPGINDNAFERAIVIHPAEYVTKQFVRHHGRLGRSFGCLALPPKNDREIISEIENKSCLFVYYPDQNYLNSSPILSEAELSN